MKLTAILAQYLYTNQKLELPGLGIFTTESPSGTQVHYEFKPGVKEDPTLIEYISQHSGKMKALASSDLESYLQQAIQFINIGKPFLMEGIGTVSKLKSGQFEFTPGILTTEKIKEYSTAAPPIQSPEELNDPETYEPFLDPADSGPKWRKPVLAILVLAGIGLAIWLGYRFSKNGNEELVTEEQTTVSDPNSSILSADTVNFDNPVPATADSTTQLNAVATAPDTYKYVLEAAGQQRALRRYNQLKTLGWKVDLETSDSVTYKIVMKLPALNADTIKVKDSLSIISGRRVVIEP